MNVANLELTLVQKINNSTSTLDTMIYSKALQKLKTGTVTTVDTYASLPAASIDLLGYLFYVKNEETFYHVVKNLTSYKWTTLRKESFDLYSWGYNAFGQIGVLTTSNVSIPSRTVSGGNNWFALAVGDNNTIGIKTDGTLWAWGQNNCGQLGNGTTTPRSSLAQTALGSNGWRSVSSGYVHTVAIKTDGTLWTWGGNTFGQLGDNTTANRCVPGGIVGDNNWLMASAGSTHTFAIKSDNTLWGWGSNVYAQLGDNSFTNRSSPIQVVGAGNNWCFVSSGFQHSAAIKTDGTLWTWGGNGSGQLGDGTVTQRSSPVTVAGGGTDWCKVSVGGYHTVAMKTDGTVWTWGANAYGQLGDGTTTARSSPATVAGGGTTWCLGLAGGAHSLGLKTDGTLWTWGVNSNGQLGDGTTTNRSSPVTAFGGVNNWKTACIGGGHSSAIATF